MGWWHSLALREQRVVGELKLADGAQVFRARLHVQRAVKAVHESVSQFKK